MINDVRDLNEAYQYFKKKYKEKWRKKIEMEEEDEGKDDKENPTWIDEEMREYKFPIFWTNGHSYIFRCEKAFLNMYHLMLL